VYKAKRRNRRAPEWTSGGVQLKPVGVARFGIAVAGPVLLALRVVAAGPAANYTGAGSCSSSQCHGSLRPRGDGRILQNEYTVWVTKDEHSQAYAHLLEERSKIIARNLRLERPPEKEPRCLACHSLAVPDARRGRSFDPADGVSCEACHGPAEKWLGPHTTRDWTHPQSVELGMRDTKDPLVRAETCSPCHVGTAEKTVDHELYAAGHPELVFEMQWASASMPRHWREASDRGAYFATRLWAVGEAVHLRDQMQRAVRPSSGSLPEFAELDCGSCHHELLPKSWRTARGYANRRPGDPPIDLTRWRVLSPLARRMAPDTAREMEAAAGELAAPAAGRPKAAERLSRAAWDLARLLNDPKLDLGRETTLALLSALAGDPAPASEFGYRGAGQIAMSIDSLSRPLIASRPEAGKSLDAEVGRLFGLLENSANYDPAAFAKALEAIKAPLREAGAASQ